jgi:hypothetical protein
MSTSKNTKTITYCFNEDLGSWLALVDTGFVDTIEMVNADTLPELWVELSPFITVKSSFEKPSQHFVDTVSTPLNRQAEVLRFLSENKIG